MTRRVFLHVGLPKSGTTYVQAVLRENKERLSDRAGLLYPGRTWEDQVMAVRDVRAATGPRTSPSRTAGAWQRLVSEMADWDGDSVVSMEWLASATSTDVGRIVASLAPMQVHVVLTVRDLARTVPAAWQEFVQNWEPWSWPEFVGAVASENPRATPPGNKFWSQQDLGKILATWRDAIPAEHLHVVTVPQSGAPAGELWSRVCRVLEVDGRLFDASGKGTNESLGLESAELMLRVNEVSRLRSVDWKTYEAMFKQALAKRGLSQRKHVETPQHTIPPRLEEWTRARTAEQIAAIEASGAQVVGDVADLEPRFAPCSDDAQAPRVDGMLEAAVEGLVFLAKDSAKELSRLRRRNTALERRAASLAERPEQHPMTTTLQGPRRRVEPALRRVHAGARRVRDGARRVAAIAARGQVGP
ncbi:MAG: hypothetical protein ACR2JU_05030 [Nocardioidaceae bacterium]